MGITGRVRKEETFPRNALSTGGRVEMKNLDPKPQIGRKGQTPDEINSFE